MQNILIVSPYFLPFAGVGANRMSSLASFLQKDSEINVTILKNSDESYGKKTVKSFTNRNFTTINCYTGKGFLKNVNIYKFNIEKLLSENCYDCIIVSIGPFYTLPLIKLIKRKYKIPVILDIRDFWAHEPVIEEKKKIVVKYIKSFIKDFLFERKAIKYADRIVAMGEADLKFLLKYYGKEINSSGIAIPNGYDGFFLNNEIKEVHFYERENEGQFNLIVYGKFAEYISNEKLNIFAESIKELTYDGYDLRIIQVGHVEERLKKILTDKGLNYHCTNYLPYAKGVLYLRENADALLLSSDLRGIGYGTKVYDYIYCNKPIIFVGDKDAGLANFLLKFKNSFVCESKKEILSAIRIIKANSILTLDEDIDVNVYNRETQNMKYKKLILSLIK